MGGASGSHFRVFWVSNEVKKKGRYKTGSILKQEVCLWALCSDQQSPSAAAGR